MTGISFIIPTSGTNDDGLNQIIDSIEALLIPQYEVIIIGGLNCQVKRNNITHIPFDESIAPAPWITRKKNTGVIASKYNNLVIMHDYHVFDQDWYIEYEKFGQDWDICIQQTFTLPSQGSQRCNGWRAGPIPGYPEIPHAMTIPWDIDCFIPYMAIQGSFWVVKKHVMLDEMLDEGLLWGQEEDIEWSSRVVPGWLGQKPDQNKYKIVANPKCVTRFTKEKPPYPVPTGFFEETSKSLEWLWEELRAGKRRPGVYHYESKLGKVVLSQ
jgi:hypothetical protein